MKKIDLIRNAYNSGHSYEDLSKRIGMVIPPDVDKNKYFIDNLNYYSSVLDRNPDKLVIRGKYDMINMKNRQKLLSELYELTDAELFGVFGYYVVYDSRKDLIENLLSVLHGIDFFVKFDEILNNPYLVVRYGNEAIRSTPYTTENPEQFNLLLKDQKFNDMKRLKRLVNIYKLSGKDTKNTIDIIEKKMNERKKWMISILPQSAKYLKN